MLHWMMIMDFSNWLFLGTGIGLGIGICKLFLPTSTSAQPTSKSNPKPVENTPQQEEKVSLAEFEQTKLAYEMAREMSSFQAGFLARTSHELRSPLNGLIGLHQLILNDLCEDPVEEREFVSQAYDRSLKLLKMIDEILSVARTEHGKNKLEIEQVNLTEFLQEVHQLTYMLAANRNYPFHVTFPESEINFLVDKRWLKQILTILIDTSITQIEEGSIYLSTNTDTNKDFIEIYLDIPSTAFLSSEAIDLVASKEVINQENPQLSSGMKLLLNQKLLAVMGGKLEVIPSPITKEVTQDLTRLKVSVPFKTPEAELPQSE
jgi:signal transduction histidine kinase